MSVPTYEYACTDCGHQFEARQSIHDAPLRSCPACGGKLRKLFGNVGVVFKGSGFYKTDSRAEAKRGKAADGAEGKKTESAGGESGSRSDSGKSQETKSSAKDAGSGSTGAGSKDSSGSKVAASK